MTWSSFTAGGSATTWSTQTAGGSNTTWPSGATSRLTFGWIPFSPVVDLWKGIDFVPIATSVAPYKASTNRPMVIYNTSTITAAGFLAERQP